MNIIYSHLRRFFSSRKPVAVELVSRGRAVIAAAFVGLGFLALYLVWYANLDQPQLGKVTVDLTGVKVLDANKITNRADLELTFLVSNPGQRTMTIASINYELYINGKDAGAGTYGAEDIPMTGRVAFYPNATIPLTNTFQLVDTDKISDEYSSVINGGQVKYTAKGQITAESTWTSITKDFESSFP